MEREFPMNNLLMTTGLASCLSALAIQLFPDAAFRLGADPAAAWLVFAFGVFLIIAGAAITRSDRRLK